MKTSDIARFVESGDVQGIAEHLAMLAADTSLESLEELKRFLHTPSDDMFFKKLIAQLIVRALMQRGPEALTVLNSSIGKIDKPAYNTAILEMLWHAGLRQLPPLFMGERVSLPAILQKLPPENLSQAAGEAFHDFIAQSQIDQDLFDELIQFLHFENMTVWVRGSTSASQFRQHIFKVLSESSIKITRSLIRKFEELVSNSLPESAYQEFLAHHPVFIDPLASEVIPKQRMGLEHVTDFAVRRLDSQYLLVEIEKPQDPIFTQQGDFSAEFSHAFGQVIDFQQWVDEQSQYARTLLPEISSPRGLLIMGRRESLSERTAAKLKRYCLNSQGIDVYTYDDLIVRAKNLYRNIHRV